MSVPVSVNFKLACNFSSVKGTLFKCGMHTSSSQQFQRVPRVILTFDPSASEGMVFDKQILVFFGLFRTKRPFLNSGTSFTNILALSLDEQVSGQSRDTVELTPQ